MTSWQYTHFGCELVLDSTYRESRFTDAAKRCLSAHIQREHTYRCSKEVLGSTHTHTQKVDWTSREQTYRCSRGVWQHTYRENRLTDAAEVLGSTHTESRLDIQRKQTYRCSRGVGQHTHRK